MTRRLHLAHDWYPAEIPRNVRVGENSWLFSSYAFLHYTADTETSLVIGKDTGIYDGTFFDLGPKGKVVIGDYCTLVGVIICTDQQVIIGDYSLIAHEVVIADQPVAIPKSFQRKFSSEKTDQAAREHGTINIGSNVWIGTGARVLSGARIGNNSIVAAGCTVDFQIPDNAIVAGEPATIVRRLSAGFTDYAL